MHEVIEVKTIGEVERIVLGSGEWDGTEPVLFSNNGTSLGWASTWAPSEDHPHPQFARVTVHRKGVRFPTEVTIRWDEQFPYESDEWAEKWTRSPMRHFGRTARMVAFRQAFRDLIGDARIEDEGHPEPEPATRDWTAEFEAATTLEQLDTVVKDARAQRVFTPDKHGTDLDRAWKMRRAILAATPAPELSPEEAIRDRVFTPVEPAEPATPTNRAARRGQPNKNRSRSKRKGRR